MSLRLTTILAAFLAIGPFTRTALAQEAPPKIGVVDTGRVLNESEAGRQLTARLESRRKELEAQGAGLQNEAKALQSRIAGLGPDAGSERSQLQQQLQQKTAELKKFSDDANQDLQKRRNDGLAEIDKIVMPVIEAIGQEGGYTIISKKFESGYLYVTPQIDITDQVIARVNANSSQSP